MHDLDQLEQSQAALAIYRRTLAYCLDEQAKFGARYLLPSLSQSMLEARENIRQIKAHLRAHNIAVADWPNDGSALSIENKESLSSSAGSHGELPKAVAVPPALLAAEPSGDQHLEASAPIDAIEAAGGELKAEHGSAEHISVAVAEPPPDPTPAPSDEAA